MKISRGNNSINNITQSLTETQLQHLDACKFLLSSGRAIGKTYLLCSAAIIMAMSNPGEPYHVFDHFYMSHRQNDFISHQLHSIIDKSVDGDVAKYLKIRKHPQITIRYEPLDFERVYKR